MTASSIWSAKYWKKNSKYGLKIMTFRKTALMIAHSVPLSVGYLNTRVWYLLSSRRQGAVSVESRSGLPFFAEEAKRDPSVRGTLDCISKNCSFKI